MKATGIVRRIDDLGRIVIPKEVRRKFQIKEGDALELFIDEKDGEIIFKLYETAFDKAQRTAKDAGKHCFELYGCEITPTQEGHIKCPGDCCEALQRYERELYKEAHH